MAAEPVRMGCHEPVPDLDRRCDDVSTTVIGVVEPGDVRRHDDRVGEFLVGDGPQEGGEPA
jgi:hypothetical protein